MRVLQFSTDALPPAERLEAFRRGAVDFRIEPLGDPAAYRMQWELLQLGDVDVVRTWASPVHYVRDQAMIDPHFQHRVTVHFQLGGNASGSIDGRPTSCVAGGAQVWDLARPLDVGSEEDGHLLIVNLPRHLLHEVLMLPSYVATVRPGTAIALATDHIGALVDHAADLPEAGAAALGRAVRDMVVAALLPAWTESGTTVPLGAQITDLLDGAPRVAWTIESMAHALGVDRCDLEAHVASVGGLAPLIERQHLLAAYRLLCDPAETAPISGIADRCGFDDMSKFSKHFRAVFDHSPSDVRRHQRGVLPRWAGSYMVDRHYAALRIS